MENLSRKEIIEKTFDEMPREFSSHNFVQALVKNGMEYKKIQTYMYQEFLINKCIRYSSKIWRKLPVTMNEQMEDHRSQVTTVGSPTVSASMSTITPADSLPLFNTVPTGDSSPINSFSVAKSDHEKLMEAVALCKMNGLKVIRISEEEL